MNKNTENLKEFNTFSALLTNILSINYINKEIKTVNDLNELENILIQLFSYDYKYRLEAVNYLMELCKTFEEIRFLFNYLFGNYEDYKFLIIYNYNDEISSLSNIDEKEEDIFIEQMAQNLLK